MIVHTPPGIGDIYWLLMKLIPSTNEPLELVVSSAENQRASFLSYIDGVASVKSGNFSLMRNKKLAAMNQYTGLESIMHLEANSHLEAGRRIEEYLPNLDTAFRLNWKTTRDGHWRARQYMGKKTIAIHTSSITHNTKSSIGIGKDWTPECWLEIVSNIYERFPDVDITWVGAKYDADMLNLLHTVYPQIHAMVGENPDVVMNFLRRCDGFIAYQCGLSVITVCESIPTYMVYFDWLTAMPYTFCPKTSVDSDNMYHPIIFNDLVKELSNPAEWLSLLL